MKKLYVMKSGLMYKIGVSKDPEKRLRQLSVGNRCISILYESAMLSNAYSVESTLHKEFSRNSEGREWFSGIDEDYLLETVKEAAECYGDSNYRKPNRDINQKFDEMVKKLFASDSIDAIKKETEDIAKENESILEIISIISANPKTKNVVIGLCGLGWSYMEIEEFISNIMPKK